MLQSRLDDCLGGPDRSVTTRTIKNELARSLGLVPDDVGESLQAVFKVIADRVSAGQIEEVRGQLPEEMKALFPAAA